MNRDRDKITMAPGVPGVIASFLLLWGSACAHRPGVFELGGQPGQDMLSSAPATPAEQLTRGWARFVLANDLNLALADLDQAARALAPEDRRSRNLAWLGAGFIHLGRAEFEAALKAFLSAIEANPQDPESLVAASQVEECANVVTDGFRKIAPRVRALLDGFPAPPLRTARVLRNLLREDALRTGKLEEATRIEHELGVVPYWRVAAPYGKHPLVSFDQDFAPEHEALRTTPRVSVLPAWPDELTLAIEREDMDGLLYAETYFRATEDTSLSVRLQGVGPWAFFADDVPVDIHDTQRRRLPEVVWRPFAVSSGWHRLLLKVPLRHGRAVVGVEVSRADGQPAALQWWKGDPPTPPYTSGHATRAPAPPESPAQQLSKRAQQLPHDAITRILAGILFWEDGDRDAALNQFAEARVHAPRFGFLHYLTGVLRHEDSELPPAIAGARSREPLERTLDLSPEYLLARFRLALVDILEGRDEQALQTLQLLDSRRPESFLWPSVSAWIQDRLGWEFETTEAYRRAWARAPDHPDLLQRSFQHAVRTHAFDEAERLAVRLEELNLASLELVQYAIERGQEDRGLRLLEKIVARYPGRLPPRLAQIDLMIGRRNLEKALAQTREAKAVFGPNTELLRRETDLLDLLKKPAEAQALRAEMLQSTSWNLQTRQAFAAAAGSNGSLLVGDPAIDTQAAIAQYLAASFKPQGSAVLVLDQATLEVAGDGSSVARIRMIVHVLTSEGLEQWGEIEDVPEGAVVEQIRTIGLDGRIHDAENIPGKESISLPALQVGDFVEVSYIEGNRSRNLLPNAFLGQRFYFRTVGLPIFRSIYSVALPVGSTPEIDAHGELPPPTRKRVGALEVLTWESERSPMIAPEPNAPPVDEYAPFVQVGFGMRWQDYRDILRVELEEAARPDLELQQFARRASAGAGTEQERVRRIFRAVCAEIKQAGSFDFFGQPATEILARREGNRLVLLTSLLRSAGFEPEVLLARTVASPQTIFRLPNENTFRHGLVSLRLPGTSARLWLDPTNRYNAFGLLYPFLHHMEALVVTSQGDGNPIAVLPGGSGPALEKAIALDFSLADDGTLAGTGSERITSNQAAKYRELLGSLGPNQRHQALEAGLASYFSGAVLESYEIGALEDPDQPLVLSYRLRAQGFARHHGNALVIRGGFYPYQLGLNLISKPERSLPLVLGDETRTSTRVVLTLPANTTVETPPAAQWSGPLSEFSQIAHLNGRQLVIEKNLVVKAGRVSAAEYPAFRDFCQRVDQKDSEEIVVHLGGVPDSP